MSAKSGPAPMPVPGPVPEIEKLAFLLGAWHAADRYEKTVFNPDGGEGVGFYNTILGPGGFSLLTDYRYEAPHGQSSGHEILTWDPKRACYAGCIVSSRFPGWVTVTGNWEGATLALAGEFEARGARIAFRQIFSDMTDTAIVLRQYNSVDGGPSLLFGTTIFTKA